MAARIKAGDKVGPYVIVEELADGGMARVFRAYGADSNRKEVALKLGRDGDERYHEAIRREGELLRKLNHPGIVSILPTQLGRVPDYYVKAYNVDGHPWFFAMEFLAGGTLKSYIGNGQFLPQEIASAIVLQVARSLHYMHGQGYAHQDTKPENIMLRGPLKRDADIAPILIDFGVAANVKGAAKGGTVVTMSPEQVEHMQGTLPPEIQVDHAKSDVYSLGVVYYLALTGQYPFGGFTEKIMTQQILNGQPTPPRQARPEANISRDTQDTVLGCLAKDPKIRYDMPTLIKKLEITSGGLTRVNVDIAIPGEKKRGFRLFG